MAEYARLYSSTWKSDFTALSHDAQWLYFTLMSQPDISNCGVLALTPGRWSTLAADTDADSVRSWLNELVAADKVHIDPRSEEVWVRAYMKRDGLARMNPNGLKSVRRAVAEVLSDQLRQRVDDELARVLQPVDETVAPTVQPPQQPAASSRDLHPRPAAAASSPTVGASSDADSLMLTGPAAAAVEILVAHRCSTNGVRNRKRYADSVRSKVIAEHAEQLMQVGDDANPLDVAVQVFDISRSDAILGEVQCRRLANGAAR